MRVVARLVVLVVVLMAVLVVAAGQTCNTIASGTNQICSGYQGSGSAIAENKCAVLCCHTTGCHYYDYIGGLCYYLGNCTSLVSSSGGSWGQVQLAND